MRNSWDLIKDLIYGIFVFAYGLTVIYFCYGIWLPSAKMSPLSGLPCLHKETPALTVSCHVVKWHRQSCCTTPTKAMNSLRMALCLWAHPRGTSALRLYIFIASLCRVWRPYCLKRLPHLPDCRNVNAVALIIGFYSHSLLETLTHTHTHTHSHRRIDILACYCSAAVSIESSIEACCVCIGPRVPLKSVCGSVCVCVCVCVSVCETARVPGTCLSACWYL